MNTPAHDENELRCAEYALGVLDAQERAALERDMERNPTLQHMLDDWHRRLAPLALDVRAIAPPARVWTRIQRDLGFLSTQTPSAAPRRGMWNSLDLWRWVGIGASVAALVLLGINLKSLQETRAPQQVPTATVDNGYMVASIARKDGAVHWTATVDVHNARMIVVPALLASIEPDKATELWLIPANHKPIALGVFPAREPATMHLPPEIMAQLNAQAVLAVSLEPPGGSPTGQPTGPVLATGEMHAS